MAASVLLIWHATIYDFVCDDAFITLRYARNLARLGAPVYNPGERVEGYTDFLWMVLNAAGALVHANPITWVRALGALSGIGLMVAAWFLSERLAPGRVGVAACVVFALALSAPVAAWTLGGLETPLFAALATAGLALAAGLADEVAHRRHRAVFPGVVLALATLTRPEGALWFGVTFVVLAAFRRRSRVGRRDVAWLAIGYLAIVVPFVVWRWRYYGYPLPNTYYVKFSGARGEMWLRGGSYLLLALRELNPILVVLTLVAVVRPAQRPPGEDPATAPARRAAFTFGRVLLPVFVLYVASVGGDFLDLYRFFVPVLPVAFGLVAADLATRAERFDTRRARHAVAAGAVLALAGHGAQQAYLARTALVIEQPSRVLRGIEPLGWTRLFALRWAAMGRWFARHAAPGDWTATGAAGAMTFYSGLNNIDTLGLCDPFVAHSGELIGDRPGHQRFAPRWYLIERRPTFIMVGDQIVSDVSRWLPSDPAWESDGWTWVEVRVGPEDGSPDVFYHRVLVANGRLPVLGALPDVRRGDQ